MHLSYSSLRASLSVVRGSSNALYRCLSRFYSNYLSGNDPLQSFRSGTQANFFSCNLSAPERWQFSSASGNSQRFFIFLQPKIFTNSSQIIFLSFSSPKEALVQIAVRQKTNTKNKHKSKNTWGCWFSNEKCKAHHEERIYSLKGPE